MEQVSKPVPDLFAGNTGEMAADRLDIMTWAGYSVGIRVGSSSSGYGTCTGAAAEFEDLMIRIGI